MAQTNLMDGLKKSAELLHANVREQQHLGVAIIALVDQPIVVGVDVDSLLELTA
jgi:hypothetical protein